MVHTIKMGVLILNGIDGKVKIARYKSSQRAIESIYSLLEFISTIQLSRERERVLAHTLFAL